MTAKLGREGLAQGAENQAVRRLQARPADLAFEDAELTAECKNLDLERGISLSWKGARRSSRERTTE